MYSNSRAELRSALLRVHVPRTGSLGARKVPKQRDHGLVGTSGTGDIRASNTAWTSGAAELRLRTAFAASSLL